MPDKGVTENVKKCHALMTTLSGSVAKAQADMPEGIEDAVCGTRSVLDQVAAMVKGELEHLDWHAKHESQP